MLALGTIELRSFLAMPPPPSKHRSRWQMDSQVSSKKPHFLMQSDRTVRIVHVADMTAMRAMRANRCWKACFDLGTCTHLLRLYSEGGEPP